ncbi:MAG: hypothetical protein QM817_23070 [Archangium sp.]
MSPYTSGIAAWPLGTFDLFTQRKIWLLIAALGLLLSFRVISRVADRETAALAIFATATSSPFLLLNSLLVPFETVPATLLVAAASVWIGGELKPLRLSLGALLAGLAVATNLKALFLLIPLAVIAWRSPARPKIEKRSHLLLAALAFVVPLAPLLIFALNDPNRGLEGQFSLRAAWALSNLQWSRFFTEPALLTNFASDFTSYFDMAEKRSALSFSWVHVAVAIPLTWCLFSGVARLAGREVGSWLSAACGVVLLTFFFVSVLLYKQYPGGNYAPLHDLMGIATAAGFVDLARRLQPQRFVAVAAIGVFIVGAGGIWHVLRRGDPAAHVATSFNANAVREATALFGAEPEVRVLTTTYNLSGVFDSMGAKAISTHQVFDVCGRFREGPDLDVCVRERWKWLLSHAASLPLRVLIPLNVASVDKPLEISRQLSARLIEACNELGLAVREEKRFSTSGGVEVLASFRVEGTPRVPTVNAPAPQRPPQLAFSEADAKTVFEAVSKNADCELIGVTTERNRLVLKWKPDVMVVVDAAEVVRVSPLAEDEKKCPLALARLREVVATLKLTTTVSP